jgi:hypothetical protein
VPLLAANGRFVPADALDAGDDSDLLALRLEERPLLDVQFEKGRERTLAAALGAKVPDRLERIAEADPGAVPSEEAQS